MLRRFGVSAAVRVAGIFAIKGNQLAKISRTGFVMALGVPVALLLVHMGQSLAADVKGIDVSLPAVAAQSPTKVSTPAKGVPKDKSSLSTVTIVAPGGKVEVVSAPAAAKASVAKSVVSPAKKTVVAKVASKKLEVKAAAEKKTAEKKAPESGVRQVEIETSLSDLGYRNGFQFDGVQSIHDEAVFFPVPKDANIQSGRVRLHYRASAMLHKQSNVRVYVNHVPMVASSLSSDGDQVLDVPVRKSDLVTKDGFVRVEIKVSMLFSDDRCLDERINGGYFYVKPETSLLVTLRDEASSLRGAWDLLPQEVKVSLPSGAVTQEVFSAAWALDELLARQNKKVSFVRLPEVGDIVIAPDAEIQSVFHQVAAGSNVSLIGVGDGRRNAIALSEPFDVTPFYLLSSKWRSLASGSQYQIFPLEQGKVGSDDKYRMLLGDMGLSTETHYVDRIVEWNFVYSADKLPAGYAPQSLEFDVTATPASVEHPAMFYVYLNDVLQQAIRLENDGKTHRVSVSVPKEGLARHNAIRLVTQREYLEGDCRGDLPRFPVQIMPTSSMVVTRQASEAPKEFLELGTYFREGFDTYLPKSYLQNPAQVLNLLTRLVIDQALAVDVKRVQFYEAGAAIKPEKPFLVLGRANIDLDYQPVRFDKGHIQVLGENGAKLLDVDRLPGVAIAQIVRTSSVSGLWVAPGQDSLTLTASNFQFDHDDVSFIDGSGVLLTLNSRHPGGVRLYYPGQRSLLEWIEEYRYWLLLAAWVALTLLVVFLFRRTRQSGAPSGE